MKFRVSKKSMHFTPLRFKVIATVKSAIILHYSQFKIKLAEGEPICVISEMRHRCSHVAEAIAKEQALAQAFCVRKKIAMPQAWIDNINASCSSCACD